MCDAGVVRLFNFENILIIFRNLTLIYTDLWENWPMDVLSKTDLNWPMCVLQKIFKNWPMDFLSKNDLKLAYACITEKPKKLANE